MSFIKGIGDLRDAPLSPELQEQCKKKLSAAPCQIANVTLDASPDSLVYEIKAWPRGLNHHIPKVDQRIIIKNGMPVGFIWYTGIQDKIQDKYKSQEEEMADLLDSRRINSIGICK